MLHSCSHVQCYKGILIPAGFYVTLQHVWPSIQPTAYVCIFSILSFVSFKANLPLFMNLLHFHLTHALTEYPALSPPPQTPLWNESEILSSEAQQFVVKILYTFLENLFKVFSCCQSVCTSLKRQPFSFVKDYEGMFFFAYSLRQFCTFFFPTFDLSFFLPKKNRKKEKAWQPKKFLE